MEQDPIVQAVERIEAALARIETASREAAALRARHEGLKTSVAQTLQDIDRLLAGVAE